MKVKAEVTDQKLRGGFYSPPDLVDSCLRRVIELLTDHRSNLRVLEPSVGDGAFLHGLSRHGVLRDLIGQILAFEVVSSEAARAKAVAQTLEMSARVVPRSVIPWAASVDDEFDIAIGNPPFVRYQFVVGDDRIAAERLADRLGTTFSGVSNLWLPVLLGALSRLRVGGVFSFIVPTECFTGSSASIFRSWIESNVEHLTIDLFGPCSFPGVLQEVIVLSGRRAPSGDGSIHVVDHHESSAREWTHVFNPSQSGNWTRYLLEPQHLDALEAARTLPDVKALGELARFSVATVTGANDYFSVDTPTLARYQLEPWAIPLLPRIRHAPGLRYVATDHEAMLTSGAKGHLLDFSVERPDPVEFVGPADYIGEGQRLGLHSRYKCRIRAPWYRVPVVSVGDLLLSKRSHHFPRVVVNEARAFTTDTIYRGQIVQSELYQSADIAAAFHSSLTLLSAELEGRSFGGGVLELVPSEVARLQIAVPTGFGKELPRLDALVRLAGTDSEELVAETDRFLVKADIGFDDDLIARLSSARATLLQRRLARNG